VQKRTDKVKCPVCHNRQFSSKELTPEIKIKTCSQCGFLLSDIQRIEPTAPEFSRINDESYQRSIGKVRQHQAREILHCVRQYAKEGGDWLDVGCSFGYLLFEAKQSGFNVFGVEPDEKAVRHARALVGDDVVRHGMMRDEIRADNSADIVSMLDVFEHIPADALSDFAGMIHRKLRPNGLWVIKVPSTEGFYFSLAHRLLPFGGASVSGVIKRLWQSEYEYPHAVYFNQGTLRRFLENEGYEVLASRYLAEVPNSTVMDRLLMDNTIGRWQAMLIAPAFYLINFIEKLRGKSDALLVVASCKSATP